MRVEAIFFDLDGTLLDTLEDLADAANACLAAQRLPTHPADAYRFFVGDGMETLMQRAAPKGTPPAMLADLAEAMRNAYGRNWDRKTRPYPGVEPMLEALAARTMPLAVLSNKPHEFTEAVIRRFFPVVPFAGIQGSPRGGKAKPDPALALAMAGSFGIRPERILFMGDSRTDMDTAVNAGMIPAGALWGFRPESELRQHGAKILLARPEDVFTYL